jgi:hypothetical protein
MGAAMNKFLTELREGVAWIWITPEEARRLLQRSESRPDIVSERREQAAFARAA